MAAEHVDKETIHRYQFICNCQRHKETDLSRQAFIEKLYHVKNLRCRIYTSYLSFYITSYKELNTFKHIHHIVNSSDFDVDYLFDRKVFMLGLPPKIYSWMKNTEYKVIYKHLINWFAAGFVFDKSKSKIIEQQLYEPLFFDAQNVIELYKTKVDNDIEANVDVQKRLYEAMSKNLTGSLPPEFLTDFSTVQHNEKWGTNSEMNIDIVLGYMRDDDWERIVIGSSTDTLDRSESNSLVFEQWKDVFQMYPITKSNIQEKITLKNHKDFVYVVQEENSNHFKIGWSTNPEVEKTRLRQMQTGNSTKLVLRGYFEVAGKNTEKVIHGYLSEFNLRGEWFLLNENQVKNILSLEWRLQNNIL